ncbi:MAG: nucleotidyltransferase domain-containing protein [Alphaproteobacteria bacterium]|nr:nucleotidyltransferase domain-containing protein [Alphaproteobacteria bacterium]
MENIVCVKIDISSEHLSIVNKILQELLPKGVKVWVFGSRAKKTARTYSDLDIALEREDEKPVALDILVRLENAFEESLLPYKVDVIDLNNITSEFKKIVERDKTAFLKKT